VREAHGEGAVADRTRHPICRPGAHVTGGEHSWTDRFEEMRLAVLQRPGKVPVATRCSAAAQEVPRGVLDLWTDTGPARLHIEGELLSWDSGTPTPR
jgi:hypothetical protein